MWQENKGWYYAQISVTAATGYHDLIGKAVVNIDSDKG